MSRERLRAGFPRERGRPARSGPQARGCSWERGRPARKRAAGPRVFLGARASRPQAGRRPAGVPGSAGVPPASGPQARGCSWERGRPARKRAAGPRVFLGARASRPQRAAGPRVFLGSRASRPQAGRRPAGVPGSAGVPPAAGRRPAGVPGIAGVPPASGPQARGCSWERGSPARKRAAGPQVFKRASRPRSQGKPCARSGSNGNIKAARAVRNGDANLHRSDSANLTRRALVRHRPARTIA